MRRNWALCSLMAVSMAAPAMLVPSAWSAPAQPAGAAYQEHGWDVPPPEFREAQRKGFHDGVEGARKDFDNHRAPNVNRRKEYRHPPVDESMRDDYRDGFRRGYNAAWQHLNSGE